MSQLARKSELHDRRGRAALERDFPIVEVSQVAEHESWRKEINRPLYHIHKWWATRLGSVFRAITLSALSPWGTDVWEAFYAHHRLTGRVVLDPFMGSGTTIGEALKLGAKAIGCDINPVSTFLVRQSLSRIPETALREAFSVLEKKVAPEIRHYYRTTDPKTGEDIPVLYFFWVKVVCTPEGEAVPLFDRYVFAQDAYPKKKPKAQIICPECWEILEDRYDATHLICRSCKHRFNPQAGRAAGQHIETGSGRYRIKDLLPAGGVPEHRLYALMALKPNGQKIYLKASDWDRALYADAVSRLASEDLPLPTLPVRPGHNTDQARGYNYLHWRDFFNGRQLLCLGILLREILRIEDLAVQEQMLCLFSSTLEFNNLFCSFKGGGTGAVRHMFSNHILKPERMPLENSVWGTDKSSGTFCSLFESRLIRAKRYLDAPFEISLAGDLFGNVTSQASKITVSDPINVPQAASCEDLNAAWQGVLILNGDSSRLPIPDASVDAVITDPPYFDFVHYSELSDFFFAWLSPVLKHRYPWFDKCDSSHPGEVQHNDPRTFARQLSSVFAECRRVLKDEGVLAFSFHHSREEGWAAIYEAITTAGLEVVAAHPVHAELRAASPKSAAKDPISLDAILVCRKHTTVAAISRNRDDVIDETLHLAKRLTAAGMNVSAADRFVIGASQSLIAASAERMSFDEIKSRLGSLRRDLMKAAPLLMFGVAGAAATRDAP